MFILVDPSVPHLYVQLVATSAAEKE